MRHGVFARFACRDELIEFIQKFIGAKLVGIGHLKVRKERVEVSSQFDFRRNIFRENWNGPGIGARPAAGITNIFPQWLALVDDRPRANSAFPFGRFRTRQSFLLLVVAPPADNIFAVMAIRNFVLGEVFPKIAAGRLAGVRNFVFDGDPPKQGALGVVGVLLTAIADGPSLGDVVGNRRGGRPDVAITRDIAAVIEIIENAELASELVLVGSDVLAVHGERRVAVSGGEIAEDLIVGAILLDDVDDVMNFVFAVREGYAIGIAAQRVGLRNLPGVGRKVRGQFREGNARKRPVNQCGTVRISRAAIGGLAIRRWIRPGAAPFVGGDEQIVGGGGNDGRIQLRRNETGSVKALAGNKFGQVENAYGVRNGIGGEKRFLVRRECEVFGIAAAISFNLVSSTEIRALHPSLAPGSYTVQVSGSGGATGISLLEVYEVP